MDCSPVGFSVTASYICIQCSTGCASCTGTGSYECTSCLQGSYYLQPSPNSNTCATTCPFGYGENNTLAACIDCAANQQVWFNKICLDACPDGYVQTDSGSCGKCSDSNLLYFNHTCVSSCPLKTFRVYNTYVNQYECKSCHVGCNTCVDGTSSGCLTCSEGFFYSNNACNTGCPSDKYANPNTRICEQCQPPCVTCSQPNDRSCTSCPPGYFLLDGTCVISCPANYYQTFFTAEDGIYQIPICVSKLVLTFNLSLTTDARVINMNFNYGIVNMIQAISQKIQVEIANTQLDDVLFVLSPLTESQIKLEYIGNQYYPPFSLVKVTIDLDTTDFNSNSFQQFRIIEKTATTWLKEIYPFSKAEKQFISGTSDATGAGGSTIATIQVASSVAQGAISLSLLRLQLVGEIVQLLRFVGIRWPPNVAEYFATSNIDPSSMLLPVDFVGELNDQLEDRNYSMPRVFEEYETSPFFTLNYNSEMSNLLIWVPTLLGCALLFYFMKKGLKKLVNIDFSKITGRKGKKKYLNLFFTLVQKSNQLLNRTDDSILWNFLIMFILSIYQSGCLWSLLNMRYASALLEPQTSSTRASLALGIIFFLFFLALFAWVSIILIKNMKYLIQTGEFTEDSQEERCKRYNVLFEDCNRKKRIQIFFVPISLLRGFLFVAVLALMTFSPITQITLSWIIHTAFIVYFIIYQPLKVRWMRIMTLLIEALAYGCVTLAFILGIIDQCIDLDATTANEIGFIFLLLTIGSTIAGGVLSLIQIVLLIRDIYQYIKNLIARKRQVHPTPLSEIHSVASFPSPNVETREKLIEGRIIESSERSFMSISSPPSMSKIKDVSEDDKIFAYLGKLSPADFEKGGTKEKQILEALREWWTSKRPAATSDANEVDLKTLEDSAKDSAHNFIERNPV